MAIAFRPKQSPPDKPLNAALGLRRMDVSVGFLGGKMGEGVFLSLVTDVCGTLNAGSLSSMSSTGRYMYNYYINTSIHYIGMIGSEIKNVHPCLIDTGGMPFRDLESPQRNHCCERSLPVTRVCQ